MKWDSEKDDIQAKEHIIGKLLAKLRGHVEIWSSKNTDHEYSDYSYSYTQTEDPTRATTQLYNLARGHALLIGRNYITLEDVPITVKVALSTASIERVATFDILLAKSGRVTLSKIAKALSMSKSTALKTMTELAALELVDLEDVTFEFNSTKQMTLKEEFNWLLTDKFAELREGFAPVDNSKYADEEEKGPMSYKEKIFWQRFDEVEKQTVDGIVEPETQRELGSIDRILYWRQQAGIKLDLKEMKS
jgi:DNA-binding transcriptional ArsR family regulator